MVRDENIKSMYLLSDDQYSMQQQNAQTQDAKEYITHWQKAYQNMETRNKQLEEEKA